MALSPEMMQILMRGNPTAGGGMNPLMNPMGMPPMGMPPGGGAPSMMPTPALTQDRVPLPASLGMGGVGVTQGGGILSSLLGAGISSAPAIAAASSSGMPTGMMLQQGLGMMMPQQSGPQATSIQEWLARMNQR